MKDWAWKGAVLESDSVSQFLQYSGERKEDKLKEGKKGFGWDGY